MMGFKIDSVQDDRHKLHLQEDDGTIVQDDAVNKIYQQGHQKNNDKYEFQKLNMRMEWEMIKIKLANKANLEMSQASQHFHELTLEEKAMVQFSFAKY